jgi:tRNA pseudouridine synthase 10
MLKIKLPSLKADHVAKCIADAIRHYEYKSFSLGIAESVDKEEKATYRKCLVEKLLHTLDATHNNQNADVSITILYKQKLATVRIRPIYICGYYNKYSRELPQTIHYCFYCKGKGCKKCNFTGKQSEASVQEYICEIISPAFEARGCIFHGAGREDKNVRMLGRGRLFVLELKEPKKRYAELESLEKQVNQKYKEVLRIRALCFCTRRMIIKIKAMRAPKKYRALVRFEEGVKTALERLKAYLEKEIKVEQRTPTRMLASKPDRMKKRWFKLIRIKRVDVHHAELILLASSGLYIKELISGDNGRTVPNIAQLANTKAECKELDVLDILYENKEERKTQA